MQTKDLDHKDARLRRRRIAAIEAIALNAAISGSILAVPDACFVMTMALPLGSTRALLP
jgi:hypothetical protein